MIVHTVENGAVGSQKAVLETLGKLSSLEGLLLKDDVVKIVAREEGDLVATVAVVNAEEGEGDVNGAAGGGLHVEYGRVGVLHADAPALHGGDTV